MSLAAALALPLYLADGVTPFPFRDLIIYLAFAVILATLVGQGLTLPFFIRRLGVAADEGDVHEEAHARMTTAEAAVQRIEELAREWPDHLELIDALRAQYNHQASHIDPHHEEALDESEQELLEHRRIRGAVVEAEREAPAPDVRARRGHRRRLPPGRARPRPRRAADGGLRTQAAGALRLAMVRFQLPRQAVEIRVASDQAQVADLPDDDLVVVEQLRSMDEVVIGSRRPGTR